MIPEFERGMKPFSQTEFRERLNEMVRVCNSMSAGGGLEFGQVFDSEDGAAASPNLEFWIEILDHQDHTDRQWLYEWRAVYIDPEDPQGALLPDPVIRWDGEVSPGVTYGLATNLAERESGLTLQRPMRTGSIVRAVLFIGANEEEEPVIQMAFSATNNERQFFATITGYTAGYYSWTECYANGDAIAAPDEPQSGTEAVNSYYGLALLPGSPKIVPNGKVVMMEHLASDVMPDLVGFCLTMEAAGDAADMRGDEMVMAPATLPTPYPPTDGAAAIVGAIGAWIEVWELDDPDNPGERIRRIYHKPPTVAATGEEFNTCLGELTDGTDAPGGGTGSFAIEDILVEPDAMKHIFSAEPEADPTLFVGGDHINLRGPPGGKTCLINHSPQGAAVQSFTVTLTDATGGVFLNAPSFEADDLGHIRAGATPVIIKFSGDEWINIVQVLGSEMLFGHGISASVDHTIDPVISLVQDSITPTLKLNYNKIQVDAANHVIGVEAASITLDLTAIIDAWWDAKTKVPCPTPP